MRRALSVTARTIAACLALLALGTGTARACGTAGADCTVEGGRYRLVLPPSAAPEAPVAAVLYLHGWGASAEGALKNAERTETVTGAGMALIVPQGIPRAGRTQRDWAVRDGRPHPRDDLAFLDAVLADAARRGVDPARVLLAGFSRGGSFVWDVACERPGLFAAYAPLSGAFWEPMPAGCAGPVALYHTHGWADRVVPIEGRSFRDGAVVQGDLFESLQILRATLGCTARQPDETATADGPRWLRHWTGCEQGRIDLMLHPGGHGPPRGWMGRMIAWFEARLSEPAVSR